MKSSSALVKYLELYAEKDATDALELLKSVKKTWDHTLVIPAMREKLHIFPFIRNLKKICSQTSKRVLAIIVINGKEEENPQITAENLATLDLLLQNAASSKSLTRSVPVHLLSDNPPQEWLDLCIIDRASSTFRFPKKEGVGLARKIGCDIALQLFQTGLCLDPYIRTTDADAHLPVDYFHRLETRKHQNIAAAIYPFKHEYQSDPSLAADENEQIEKAMRLYDAYLRYYVKGLAYAGSPYAFDTVGSTITIQAKAYAEVRGFPKKAAGEDFYLLNKLAKVGKIESLSGAPLILAGRPSDRVPFGTGASIRKILNLLKNDAPYTVYQPEVFDVLKIVLESLTRLYSSFSIMAAHEEMENLLDKTKLSCNKMLLLDFLKQQELWTAAQEALKKSTKPEILEKHVNTWFDAFKTLKFIHELRDHFLPDKPLEKNMDFFT